MDNTKNFKEWRSEEIAKVFLLKTDFKVNIENYPTPLLDLFITLKDNSEVKFAVEVKTNESFSLRMRKQIEQLKVYWEANMLNIPVFIFKINDEKETGEFDFLVFPSFKENKLLIRTELKFQELNNENFSKKMGAVIKWYSNNYP